MSWVKISTTSFSAAASVSVDNCFSSAYTHYLITRNLSGGTAGNALGLRLRVSSTDATAAQYRYQTVNASATTVAGARTTAATSWADTLGYTEASVIGYGQAHVSNPFDTVNTTAWTDRSDTATGNIVLQRVVYAHDAATSYTGFTVIPSASTITGSITVYGLRAS